MSPEHINVATDGLDPVELTAAEWLVRQDHGLTEDEAAELSHWLQVNPRHAAMHARLKATWGLLGKVPAARFPVPASQGKFVFRWALPLAAAAAVAVGLFVLQPWRSSGDAVREAQTDVGGFKNLQLADGSVVTLNTDSQVDVAYTAVERRLRLGRGEANFSVRQDPLRPFIVQAGGVAVRAVGTAFNVRLDPATVEVLVTEGSVRVDDATSGRNLLTAFTVSSTEPAPTVGEPHLTAGQGVKIALGAGAGRAVPAAALAVDPEEMQRRLAWQPRTLVFSDEPLAGIVAEFNRYNRHQLVITDPRLGTQRFGGKFPVRDHAALVSFLEANFQVVAETEGDRTRLRLAR